MHRKYAQDGLVAISVTLDDPDDKEAKGRALKFLQKQKATLMNYQLLDDPNVWLEKLKISAPPCIYVFNRENQWVAKLEAEKADYVEVEKLVRELLKK